MEIKVPHHFVRILAWLACIAGTTLGVIFAIGAFSTGGQWWVAPLAFACCTLSGNGLGLIWMACFPKLEISEKGVLAKRFFRTRFYGWKDFIQAGVTWTRNRGFYYHEIVLLLPGGSKRQRNDVLFYFRNIPYILYLPYRDDVLIYLLQGYGKLDFCFLNGSDAEDYYSVEEQEE